MNSDIMELYQAVILDHNKNPKNYRKIEDPTCASEGYNPLCGDHLHIYLRLNPNTQQIEDISFEGEGCAISKASASMMTEALKGKKQDEAIKLFEEFHRLLTKDLDPDKDQHHLGKLKIFSGIWKYPSRVKCAALSWHAMRSGLAGDATPVKTES